MLDFSKRKKKYFDVGLHDGTKLQIPTPTMAAYDAMKNIDNNSDKEELYEMLKKILSTNKKGIDVTEEQVRKFELDDMIEFFVEYAEFVKLVLVDPNSKSPVVQ